MTRIRSILLIEGIAFAMAALVHAGVLLEGYEHRQAASAETVIAVVLFLSAAFRTRRRWIALVGQGFALLGTLVGVTMVAIGVGPQTQPDIVYHAAILLVLIAGMFAIVRHRGPRLSP